MSIQQDNTIASFFVDSAGLLGALISSSSRLVLPYVPPILRALLLKLRTTTQLVVLQSTTPAAVPKGPAQPGQEHIFQQIIAMLKQDHCLVEGDIVVSIPKVCTLVLKARLTS